MKYWILCLMHLTNRIDRLCERIEEEIDVLSCDLKMDTYRLFEAVLALGDKRTRLINFKVIGDMLKKSMTEAEQEIVARRIRGESFETIGEACGVSKATASRRFQAIVTKCAAITGKLTFNEERFENEYRDIPLIYRTMLRFRKREASFKGH